VRFIILLDFAAPIAGCHFSITGLEAGNRPGCFGLRYRFGLRGYALRGPLRALRIPGGLTGPHQVFRRKPARCYPSRSEMLPLQTF